MLFLSILDLTYPMPPTPRQDILGQYSMVNLELFSIVDEMKKVSKAFLVYPKNVNAENATGMFSSFPFS